MNQDKEVQNLEKRLAELSRTAYQRDIITYSDFLNLNEQNILHTLPKDRLYTKVVSFGGYEMAERQMAAFIPEALYLRYGKRELSMDEICFPFCALRIAPVNFRFAEDLTHRDYLGAVLNLGIERSRTGDIIPGEKGALLFVHNDIADFVSKELTRVRRTSVSAAPLSLKEVEYTPKFEEVRGAKVYVNGRLITSNGYQPEEGDIISVRGMGKFRYEYAGGRTRKNRLSVVISRYV